jgi:hypothetical protein
MLKSSNDETLSRLLRVLPRRIPPSSLRTALRVRASLERQRLAEGWLSGHPAKTVVAWYDRLRLTMHNAVWPVALPAAGGVFSAVVLLGMWLIPYYPVHASSDFDVPTGLTANNWTGTATSAAIRATGAVAVLGADVVVDVTIDDLGRMIDYRIVSGPTTVQDPDFRRRLENLLLFSLYVPATTFGQPGLSTLRLSLFSSAVDVRG